MGSIRAGGLASGLDTNAIIDSLVAKAKEPITGLENQLYLKNLQKTLYKSVNTDLTTLKSSMFNLKLESTFKAKKLTSSAESVSSATVSSTAATGSHVLQVLQTAKKATMSSRFTSTSVNIKGAGLSGINKLSLPAVYSQTEGAHLTNVFTSGSKSYAVTEFEFQDKRNVDVFYTNSEIDSSKIDANGNITSDFSGSFTVNVGKNGTTKSYNINIDTAASSIKTVQELMYAIDKQMNAYINAALGTGDTVQQVAVRADYEADYTANTGKWFTNIYNVTTEGYDLSFSANGSSDLNKILGLDASLNKSSVSKINQYHVADNYTDLQTKLQSKTSGIIEGVQLEFTTLSDGMFQIIQDASMNIKKANKTAVLSGAAGTSIDPTKKLSETNGLSYSNLSDIVGTFTINGTKITVDNKDITINELMAIVNSSGAGVTMSFDSSSQRFMLQSNTDGKTAIKIGADGDTSKFSSIFKLTSDTGMTSYPGNDKGSIDTSVAIAASGTTRTMIPGIFTVNGTPIYVNPAKDSIDDLLKKINNSGAGITVVYDKNQDKFLVQGDSSSRISFGSSADTSNALDIMGLTYAPQQTVTVGEAGQNAVFKLDGQTYTRTTNAVDDVLTGVSFSLTGEGTTTIDINVDTSKSVDALASFIKTYNSLLQKLNPGTISKDDRDDKMEFLTDDKKKSMSDDDLKSYMTNFDALHTQDMILKSRELRDLAKSLRSNALGVAINTESTFKSLADLGITVAGAGEDITISRKGYLLTESTDLDAIKKAIEDNTKLMNNLKNNSDDVYTFFTQSKEVVDESSRAAATKADGTVDESKLRKITYTGWAKQYETMINNYTAIDGAIGIKTRTDSPIEKEITRITKEIARKQTAAEAYLERLWKQFSAMETRVASINSQAQYLNKISGQSSSSSSSS